MQERIQEAVKDSTSLDEIKDSLISLFQQLREEDPNIQIEYVSGVITSEGPEHIERNIKTLTENTEKIKKKRAGAQVFSAPDTVNREKFMDIKGDEIRPEEWITFWREIIFHTDAVHMTPRWEKSRGATDEHQTAIGLEKRIYYYTEEQLVNL